MQIVALRISDLRVLRHLTMNPGPGINFVVGDNGAGKTSVLEAIYLAGRGRSFRHVDAGPLIREGSDHATVFVETGDGSGGQRSMLGIRRERKALICRLNGRDIRKRSELAESLPVQWIGSQPQLLLGLGPDVRRRFIDMGLFHVEHSYLATFGEFQRNLRQRNAAIRGQSSTETVRLWNGPLAKSAQRLHEYRARFIDALFRKTTSLLRQWAVGYELSYRYRQGWKPAEPLVDQYDRNLENDLRLGYTSRGPQRAELLLLADEAVADKTLSRGQQKILVLALQLALLDTIRENNAKTPILLIDDLAAELDADNRARIMCELESRDVQAFLTKIDEHALVASNPASARRFHVEHGAIVD